MKITIEHYEEKFTYEGRDDLCISELIEHLYGLCIAVGYHPESVGGAMYDKGQDVCQVEPENNIYEYEEVSKRTK